MPTWLHAPSNKQPFEKTYSLNSRSTSRIKPAAPRPFFIFRWWWWEIGAISLSTLCITAMTAILSILDGKPLSAWKLPIAPNTAVSILSTFAKTSLLVPVAEAISQSKWLHYKKSHPLKDLQVFDDASRGPWGALQLLWEMRMRTLLASFGALITIAMLGLEPSAQQIVSFSSKLVSMGPNSASMPYAEGLHVGQDDVVGSAFQRMQSAISTGIFGQQAPLPFTCAGSNCYWPDFASLGLTSKCSNVTSKTTVDCYSSLSGNETSLSCLLMTPSGFAMNFESQGVNPIFNSQVEKNGGSLWTPESKPDQNGQLAPTDRPDQLVQIATGRIISWDNDTKIAQTETHECEIAWSTKVFQGVSSINGTLIVNSTSTISMDGDLKPSCNQNEPTCQLAGRNYEFNSTEVLTLKNRLNQVFIQYVTFKNGFFTPNSDSGIGQTLFVTPDVTVPIARVAESLSQLLRTNGGGSRVLRGEAFQRQTIVSVQWAWLAVPVASVLLTAIFLSVTAIRSSQHQMALWKSSSLALLFHELQVWSAHDLEVDDMDQLMKKAEEMRVELRRNEVGNLKFVSSGKTSTELWNDGRTWI
ncbi:hypothetical protein K402DRAFT_91502 [Aulographum hederae CBS 113979]|uniref:Uncharacterized protein n=1 Tax=Aulographum hederae CBS 113979 TaxID=1176131 RepID=A0A6G1GZ16_9PEZI|nr:hypothetical protein K402DRAFT_91502 [Aulographum hederae CBS 113979]